MYIVLNDSYTKLKGPISVAISFARAETILLNNRAITYKALPHHLTNDRLLFVSKFFAAVKVCLEIKPMKTTA